MKKKIYLASPFFNSNELTVYFQVIKALRSKGYEVYVPQEHEIKNAWDYPNNVWGQKVYEEDVKALEKCDVVMILNFGMYSDSGTAWEAGFAFGIGKECVQVLCGYDNAVYSLMMMNGCQKVISIENVEHWEEESAFVNLEKIIQKKLLTNCTKCAIIKTQRKKGVLTMYYKTQNQIAQLAFPKFAKEDFSVFDLPKEEQKIMDLFANTTDIVAKIEVVKTLVNYDNRTFYANEIGLAGGTITNLKMFSIIKETGEERKIMMPLGDGLFRECVAKEWELNVPKAKLQNVVSAIIEYLYNL